MTGIKCQLTSGTAPPQGESCLNSSFTETLGPTLLCPHLCVFHEWGEIWHHAALPDGDKMEAVTDFIFSGSKITVDGDRSHEIKRHLLLGIKFMTNLDSVLKIRDITLLTKVHRVKALVLYRFESWTIKKAEHQRTDTFILHCWKRLLRVPWATRRSNQSILKEIIPEYSLEVLMLRLKLQFFGHLM